MLLIEMEVFIKGIDEVLSFVNLVILVNLVNSEEIVSVSVFNVWPKTTRLLAM